MVQGGPFDPRGYCYELNATVIRLQEMLERTRSQKATYRGKRLREARKRRDWRFFAERWKASGGVGPLPGRQREGDEAPRDQDTRGLLES